MMLFAPSPRSLKVSYGILWLYLAAAGANYAHIIVTTIESLRPFFFVSMSILIALGYALYLWKLSLTSFMVRSIWPDSVDYPTLAALFRYAHYPLVLGHSLQLAGGVFTDQRISMSVVAMLPTPPIWPALSFVTWFDIWAVVVFSFALSRKSHRPFPQVIAASAVGAITYLLVCNALWG